MSPPENARDVPLPLQPDVVDMPDVVASHEPPGAPAAGEPPSARLFRGHPRGLYPLFFTEMWERFSFFLMLALLVLYLENFAAMSEADSSDVTTWYLSLVYFTPVLGGLIADRLTGYSRAIVLGGLLMMAGLFVLAIDYKPAPGHPLLYVALGLLICGNGLFKPNISTIVGNLYAPGDPSRDRGFTIFYMGINLGAMLGPLAGAWLRARGPSTARSLGLNVPDEAGWHLAFAAAGVGMMVSLLVFLLFRRRYESEAGGVSETARFIQGADARPDALAEDAGDRVLRFGQSFNMGLVTFLLAWLLLGRWIAWPEMFRGVALWPTDVENFAILWLAVEAVTVLIFLSGRTLSCANAAKLKSVFFIVALFWMAFHQNWVTLTFFAEQHTDTTWRPESFTAVNPAFVLVLGPLMVLFWNRLGRTGREPSSVTKMMMALAVTGLAYLVMVSAGRAGGDVGKVSPLWLVSCYALLTVAELWLSPIGLSLTSKLAPPRYRGMWMGFWFLATAVGNKLVHLIGRYWGQYPPSQLFLILVVSSVGAAVALDYILINLDRFGPPSTEV